MKWQLIWLFMLLMPFHSCLLAAQEYKEKNILVLYSHEKEVATYAELDRAMRSALQSDSTYSVVFYTEYLDLSRFPEARHQRTLVDYLRLKYSNRKIDLVILVSPPAFNFFIKHGDQLFPGIPAVFTSVDIRRVENLQLKPNITGIAVKRDLRNTLDLALRLQPDTVGVVIPAGSSSIEKSLTEEMRKNLSAYAGRVSITVLTDLPMNDMIARLKNLPPHTVVLFSASFFYDAAGNYFLPEEVLDLIAHSANAPVYSTNGPDLGHGIIGGSLLDLVEPGQEAGKIGKRILSGESPASIPVQTIDPNHIMVDARQLERWGISQKQLPAGSIVKFNQESAWNLYKWYILACIFLVVLQSLLILTLVVQSRKLRRSEAMLKDLSRHLITVQEEERRRIARELHDDFGQRLALLKIELEILNQEEGRSLRAGAKERLRGLLSNVDELATDIQGLSHTLHSSKLQYVGLQGALKELCRQVSKQHHIAVDLKVSALTGPVPDEIALCFYRVAQEALHNAAKHSGARHVVVAVSSNHSLFHMVITDDGKGFNQAETSLGLGLASMRERLQMVGGQLLVQSKPGSGTELEAQAPSSQSSMQFKAS
jgi:signal transduction histidine kinase